MLSMHQLYSTVFLAACISVRDEWELFLLYIFNSTWYCQLFLFVLILSILTNMQNYLIVIWIFNFLKMNETKFSYSYLQSICLLWKSVCSKKVLVGFCFSIVEFWEPLVFLGCKTFFRYVTDKYFLQIYGLSLHSLNTILHRAKWFDLMKSNFSSYSLVSHTFGVIANNCLIQGHKDLPFSSNSFIVLGVTFRCIIHI